MEDESIRLYAIKTGTIKIGDNLVERILHSIQTQGLQFEDNDALALTSKIVSYAEDRLTALSEIKPSEKAKKLAKQYSLKPELAELILREADEVYGGVDRAVLTLKNSILTANAGIDVKNAPEDYVVLWPSNVKKSASQIREEIKHKTGRSVAVMIIDSGLLPLRIGTVGLTMAVAGFNPIKDYRSKDDIYGKRIVITRQAVADDLASAAHVLMGEAVEKVPTVLIRDAPVSFDNKVYGSADMAMTNDECIFMGIFNASKRKPSK
jgi:coenzyme F420-0:L-glutamate ligase